MLDTSKQFQVRLKSYTDVGMILRMMSIASFDCPISRSAGWDRGAALFLSLLRAAMSERSEAGYEIPALNETVSVRFVSSMSATCDVLQRRQVAGLKR